MIAKLQKAFPDITLQSSDNFVWSPGLGTVFYDQVRLKNNTGQLSLLHEIGHALLKHTDYDYDIELVTMEVEAWEKARQLAKRFRIKIDEDHINHCLETYRYWIYKRSLCPECGYTGAQQQLTRYYCFACNQQWRLSPACTSRPYRIICELDSMKNRAS